MQSKLLTSLTVGLFMSVLSLSLQVIADQDSSTNTVPRLIPYHGFLEKDGQPLNGDDQWFKLEILGGSIPYTQTVTVNIHEGRFTALLGPTDDNGVHVQNVVEEAGELLIQMTILGEHNLEDPASTAGDDVVLSNPRKLFISPFTMMANSATAFEVGGDLTVSGNVYPKDNDPANGTVDNQEGSGWKTTTTTTMSNMDWLFVDNEVWFNNNFISEHLERGWGNANHSAPPGGDESQYYGTYFGDWAPGENLTPVSSSICWLRDVREFRFGGEFMFAGIETGCRIAQVDGHWQVQSRAGNSHSQADIAVECGVECFSWAPQF